MRPERALAGTVSVAAASAGASTAFGSGNATLGIIFAVLGLLAVVATFAPSLRFLNALPLIGAIRPPSELTFAIQGHDGLVIETSALEDSGDVVLRVGIPSEGRTHEITRVTVNAYVVGSTRIARVQPNGARYPNGGLMDHGPDGPYWSISGFTIPISPFLLYFKARVPAPGDYEIVVSLQSPDFYDKEDHRYTETLTVRHGGGEA